MDRKKELRSLCKTECKLYLKSAFGLFERKIPLFVERERREMDWKSLVYKEEKLSYSFGKVFEFGKGELCNLV